MCIYLNNLYLPTTLLQFEQAVYKYFNQKLHNLVCGQVLVYIYQKVRVQIKKEQRASFLKISL